MRRRDKYRYKLVWDTSALINIKEPNAEGYSPGHSLWKDLSDGLIRGPYLNIIPAVAAFEVPAAVSGKRRGGGGMSHDFYLMGDHEVLYPIGRKLISATHKLFRTSPFDQLRGADLIFACIAKQEGAWLVTLDSHFRILRDQVTVIDLNDSRDFPRYLDSFEKNWPIGGLVRP